MSGKTLPIAHVIKHLSTGAYGDFELVLKTIKSADYIKESILKNELGLLATKILKLLKSNEELDVWKGCHLSYTICLHNPLVLSVHSGDFLKAIFLKVEQMVNFGTITNTKQVQLIKTCVTTLGSLMDLMRNKPTLSRESLVPNLRSVITLLLKLCPTYPQTCLPVLASIASKNTTTFKPFNLKFRQELQNIFVTQYIQLDTSTQALVCKNWVYTHFISSKKNAHLDDDASHHKVYHDDVWKAGLFNILAQYKDIILLFGEIMDFEEDSNLSKLIAELPGKEMQAEKEEDTEFTKEFLPKLHLDLNEPLTLWKIPERLQLLTDIVVAFVTTPTPYAVRIPMGLLSQLCETLLSITHKYIPIKRELRSDSELISVVYSVHPEIQVFGILLWIELIKTLGNSTLLHYDNMLSSMDLFIPLRAKTNDIDFTRCSAMKPLFMKFFQLLGIMFETSYPDAQYADLIVKSVEIALNFTRVEDRLSGLFTQNTTQQVKSDKSKKKSSNAKNTSGSLSDLFTHPDIFIPEINSEFYDSINRFLISVMKRTTIQSPQHVKVVHYAITVSVQIKSETGIIPETFAELLRTIVLNPGKERLTILPIANNLLKEVGDEVYDVICHPKFPIKPIQRVVASEIEYQEASHEASSSVFSINKEESAIIDTDSTDVGVVEEHRKIVQENKPKRIQIKADDMESSKVDESLLFKRPSDSDDKSSSKKYKSASDPDVQPINVIETVSPVKEVQVEIEEDSEDDFVIPEIALSDDDDAE